MTITEIVKKASDLQYDSRLVDDGDLFFAIKGAVTNGNKYIFEAQKRHCLGVISEDPMPQNWDRLWLQVPDVRQSMAEAAQIFYDFPDKKLKIVGITGTNGKSTVTNMVAYVLEKLGYKTGLLGTLEYRLGNRTCTAIHTTPESIDLFRYLNEMVQSDCSHCVMEVSSHGLLQKRVFGLQYQVAALTNISQDHLDFHASMENYRDAKMRLFDGRNGTKPLHALVPENSNPKISDLCMSYHGSQFQLHYQNNTFLITTPLIGRFNVDNLCLAFQILTKLDLNPNNFLPILTQFQGIPGRMEQVALKHPFSVIIDYAHTPDALEKVLSTLRSITPGQIITVFGCGGNRDATKRNAMSQAAVKHSNKVYATSDNPRNEPIESIFADMTVPGISFIQNRKEAIQTAIMNAKPGDCVLIAGKGHENYQEIQGIKYPFNDKEIAQEILQNSDILLKL